jgi:cyclic pyranopterin monophosphate synthase
MSRYPMQAPVKKRSGLRMVDITLKETTVRTAVATGRLFISVETVKRLRRGSLPKGDALAAAQLAGIHAAKRTHDLIPMCHPLMLTSVELGFMIEPGSRSGGVGAVKITASVKTTGQTGVEMEALTAVAVAALTIYDMCKAVDREMIIGEIALLSKTGGRSGDYHKKQDGHA